MLYKLRDSLTKKVRPGFYELVAGDLETVNVIREKPYGFA